MSLEDIVNNLDDDITYDPASPLSFDEVVVDKKTGQPRQAGAELPEGQYITQLRLRAESSLYFFAKGVLGRDYLSPSLHVPFCKSLVGTPPYRKLRLMPREHAKTSIVSHALPMHIHIQPADNNLYFPGRAGVNIRVLLAGEKEERASNNLSVIQNAYESNPIVKAFWPHVCWDEPRKQAKKWNNQALVLPRDIKYPDPSLQAIGVGGAITGARFDVIIKDDIISIAAANSPVVMQTATDWHVAVRALMESAHSLEFIVGTRWAVMDTYQYIIDNDPTVDVEIRQIVENGACIYPEKFSLVPDGSKHVVSDLQKEHGSMFWLLYMNSVSNPELTDFPEEDLRHYIIEDGHFKFRSDPMDIVIREKEKAPLVAETNEALRGMPLNKDTFDQAFMRNEYLRLKTT